MNISGLDKADVLATLYNAANQVGLGHTLPRGTFGMTAVEAKEYISKSADLYFDYLHGRVLKICIRDDEVDTRLYNRDNGNGAAETAIERLRP